ncbi:MAG: YtxH domain-containing protein [bacterium]|nr:YtxH domain-containing protein [bacterium]
MAKNNTQKFLGGAIAGLALGVAASIFVSSKKGKELREDVKDRMADFYKYIVPKVKKIEKMGEKEYKEFMKNAVGQYSKARKISEDVSKEIVKEAQKSWHYFSKHL